MAMQSIAKRISTGIATLIIGAFAVALTVNYLMALTQSQAAHQKQLTHQLTLLSNSLETPLWSFDDNAIELIGDAYMASADVVSLKIFSPTDDAAIFARVKTVDEKIIYGQKKISHEGEIIGHIEIGLSGSAYTSMLSRLLDYSIIVTLLIVTSMFIFMHKLLRKYLAKPLEALESWTDQLAKGDYGGPPPEISADELTAVVHKFSNMAEKIHQRELSLQNSESRFRELANLLPGIVFETDLEGRITYTNQTGCNILQYTPEDISSGLLLTQLMVDSDVKRAHENIETILSGEQDGEGKEYIAFRKDGSSFPMLSFITPIMKKTQVTGLRGIGLDISTSRKLEEQLSQSHKMEAIGTMAGGIAHDFNNLLAIIAGNTEIIQRKHQAGNPFDKNIDNIKSATGRAINLVKQILAFSRQDKHEFEAVDLHFVIYESLRLLRSTLPTSVEIISSIEDGAISVNADTTQLQQVIFNLCTNAVHAMDEKGLLTIKLEGVDLATQDVPMPAGLQRGNYAKLSVTDTGTGMDKETIARVFDPFFTTKEVSKGTGMGLSVAHGIIKKHGGLITVDSSPGLGSTFNVYLPSIGETKTTPVTATTEPLPLGTERLLVVDDEECIAAMYVDLLGPQGYKVTSATSSTEALALFRENPEGFDLVLTDQTMPEMTGAELASELMTIRQDIPIILCSGFGTKISKEEIRKLGIREFCQKPVDREKLTIVIRKALDENDPHHLPKKVV